MSATTSVSIKPSRLSTTTTQRIRSLALWGELVCGLSILVLLGTTGAAMLDPIWRDTMMFGGIQLNGAPPIPFSKEARECLLLLSIPAVLCQAFALWVGMLLFRGYRRGEIFARSSAKLLTRIGWALFAQTPICMAITFMLGRVLANTSQPGAELSLSFNVTNVDLGPIAFGLLAVLIGKVLGEAVRLAEENEMFI
jgi:Protein of unknown function (DUF2975)